MKTMNLDLHPIGLVPLWHSAVGNGWDAHFSRYKYVPQSIDDYRTPIQVALAEVTPSWLRDQLNQLGPGEELAMHSTLTQGRRIRHIPMVDFALKSGGVTEVAIWAHHHLGIDLQFFDSGRSFHAYGTQPISKTQWVRLMGLLLLGNAPDRDPVVDSRWIGHRLLAGYSSLRWSKNTAHYIRSPTFTPSAA